MNNNKNNTKKTYSERKKEWDEIEELVMLYQKQFDSERQLDIKQQRLSRQAGERLLERFDPLIKKYTIIVTTGQINFDDKETKAFVSIFIDDPRLKGALTRKRQTASIRDEIYKRFNFVKATYGSINEEEIRTDLQILLLKLAKKYKQMGKSFCGYVATTYKYEVFRHIKKHIENPLNIPYRHEEYLDQKEDESIEVAEYELEDSIYEDNVGLPDISWIKGMSCSDIFSNLTPIQRKVLIKYYLEDCNDKEIAYNFGIDVNAANKIRRTATIKLADNLGLDKSDIKRNRKVNKAFTKRNNIK